MRRNEIYHYFEKTSWVLLCVLMADCCITGAGRWLLLGPLSFRMGVLVATLLAFIPVLVKNFRNLLRNKLIWTVGLFLLWIVVAAVCGLISQNSLSLMLSDLKGFCYFVLLPVAVCLLNSKKRIHILMKVMMYASTLCGFILIFHLITYIWFPKIFGPLYEWGLTQQFSAISGISPTIPRLFFRSSAYFLVSCSFATYFQVVEKKINVLYSMITALGLFSLVISYTRSLYLGVGVAALTLVVALAVCISREKQTQFWMHLITSVVAMCLMFVLIGAPTKSDYIGYAISRTLVTFDQPDASVTSNQTSAILSAQQTTAVLSDPATIETSSEQVTSELLTETETSQTETSQTETSQTETSQTEPSQTEPSQTEPSQTEPIVSETLSSPQPPNADKYQHLTQKSDQLRAKVLDSLIQMIKASPIIGNGLGASIGWRDLNEYFYLDLWMKAGLIGVLLYFLPTAYIVGRFFRSKRSVRPLLIAWLCVLFGFMSFSFFNPYMNASLGILYYCCVIGVSNACFVDKETNEEDQP